MSIDPYSFLVPVMTLRELQKSPKSNLAVDRNGADASPGAVAEIVSEPRLRSVDLTLAGIAYI